MRKFKLYFFLTCHLLLVTLIVDGQLIAGNAFLEGTYIRLGLNNNAAFGSSVPPPTGFIPLNADVRNAPVCNRGKIGFVADVNRDGWDQGLPAFVGDYFLPGTPEEGWAISFNGTNYNNNRSPAFIPGFTDQCVGGTEIPGTFTRVIDLADRQLTEWEGFVNGMRVVKKITLPKNKLYFIIETTLYNTTTTAMTDVYYMRNVDPDNEVAQAGNNSFVTNNTIEFQNPSASNKALVSAIGNTYNSYLGLGSIDCRARVCIRGGSSQLANRSPADVYNAATPRLGALADNVVQDAAIAVAFKLGPLAPGDSVRCAFAYILLQEDLEEALGKTAPQFEITGQVLATGGSYINCTSNPVPINILNGNDIAWTWSPATNLNTTTGTSVIHTPQATPITYTVSGLDPLCGVTNLTLTIYPPSIPLANFDANTTCGSKTASFNNLSQTLTDPSTTYRWDFGDGQTSTTVSPTHTYTNFGIYDVKLTVITPTLTCGNDTVFIRTINISDGATAAIVYNNNACVGRTVNFSGQASYPTGTITGHLWTFPGGVTYSTQNVAHTFTSPGDHAISYEVTTGNGCITTVPQTIKVETVPVASFDAVDGCVNKPVSFTNTSSNASGAITQYAWDFGNGVTSSLPNPAITFANPGIQTVQLIVQTANGCSATTTKTLNIESLPLADFVYTNACPNTTVFFTDRSTTAFGNITSYTWNFDNGNTSNLVNPSTVFTQNRNYTISLKVVTTNGCESLLKNIVIPVRSPLAHAGRDTLVFKDAPFRLRGKGGVAYRWTPTIFLDDATAQFPTANINNDQVFTLEVTDERGCIATDQVKISVFIDDGIFVPTLFTPNNDGKNDLFRPIAPPGVVKIFEVYNRWGQKIYSANDLQRGWDGKLQSVMQPNGVYVWFLKAITRKGEAVQRKGTVVLSR